jgi:hypothetical protein
VWLKIGSALLLGMMLLLMLPQARTWLKNSPKAQPGDWLSFLLPLACVAGLIILLMLAV